MLSILVTTEAIDRLVYSNTTYAQALKEMESGDTITLKEGIYSGIDACSKVIAVSNVTIRSQVSDSVIIDCNFKTWHFSVVATNVRLKGLSLTNGLSQGSGGCISVNATGISIEDTRLVGCASNAFGGGMVIDSYAGNVILKNIEIISSSAVNGGGIYVAQSASVLFSNQLLLVENSALNSGGALYLSTGAAVSIVANGQFSENSAIVSGGEIYTSVRANLFFAGNVSFISNSATSHSTSTIGGAIFASGSNIVVETGVVSFQENTCAYSGGALGLFSGSTWQSGGDVMFIGKLNYINSFCSCEFQNV